MEHPYLILPQIFSLFGMGHFAAAYPHVVYSWLVILLLIVVSFLATRTITLADPHDPLSLTSATDTVTVNGRRYTSTFDAASLQMTDTTPLGRQRFTIMDAQGRVVGMLQVAQSLLTVDEVQERLIDVLMEGMTIAVALALAAGVWLAGRLLLPITTITDTARRIGASEVSSVSSRIAASSSASAGSTEPVMPCQKPPRRGMRRKRRYWWAETPGATG